MRLPDATMRVRERSPCFIRTSSTAGNASFNVKPTLSISDIGAAPVPPSPPSTVIKSGADSSPRSLINTHNSSNHCVELMTVLNPTGFPDTVRIRSIISNNSAGELISG